MSKSSNTLGLARGVTLGIVIALILAGGLGSLLGASFLQPGAPDAVTQTVVQTKTATETVAQTATQTVAKTETQVKTETATQTQVQTKTQTQTKTITEEAALDIPVLGLACPWCVGRPDPHDRADIPSIFIHGNVYDRLVDYDSGSPPKLIPIIAEDLPVISSDGLEYTFTLKRGLKFHDGSEVTAEAIKYSADRMTALKKGWAFLFNGIIGPDSTTVVDKYTVKITLLTAHAPFLAKVPYLFIVNPTLLQANEVDGDWGNAYLNAGNDVGSGPYRLVSYKSDEGYLLKAFTEYHRGWEANQIPTFRVFIAREEATQKQLLDSGATHASPHHVSAEFFKWAQKHPRLTLEVPEKLVVVSFAHFNNQKAPLDDVHVRRAIAHLHDWETLVKNIRGDLGDSAPTGPMARGIMGHNDQLKMYEFSLEKAKAELAKSKYTDIRPITCNHIAGNEWQRLECEMLAANAQKIGLTIKPEMLPWGSYVSAVADPETSPDIVIVQSVPVFLDPDAVLYGLWHSNTIHSFNTAPAHYSNARVDKLLEEARVLVDTDERIKRYKEVQQIVQDDSPSIFLQEMARIWIHDVRLQGMATNLGGFSAMKVYNFWWDPSAAA